MVIENFTDPYSDIEAWVYDTFIAAALTAFIDNLGNFWHKFDDSKALALDVGCGGGQNAMALLEKLPKAHITGVDLSHAQITRAQKRTAQFANRCHFEQGDALALPYHDNSFDIVYSIASIKHWPSQEKGLQECIRVLKPGGALLILEADKEADFETCENFVKKWRIPFFLTWPATIFFQQVVAAQALTTEQFESLAENSILEEFSVSYIEGLPGIYLQGVK